MKVNVAQEAVTYQPITLAFEFETLEEAAVFRKMLGYNVTTPQAH